MYQNVYSQVASKKPRKASTSKYAISYQNKYFKKSNVFQYYSLIELFTETIFRYIYIGWYIYKHNPRARKSFRKKIFVLFWKSCKQVKAAARINIYPNKSLSALVLLLGTLWISNDLVTGIEFKSNDIICFSWKTLHVLCFYKWNGCLLNTDDLVMGIEFKSNYIICLCWNTFNVKCFYKSNGRWGCVLYKLGFNAGADLPYKSPGERPPVRPYM